VLVQFNTFHHFRFVTYGKWGPLQSRSRTLLKASLRVAALQLPSNCILQPKINELDPAREA
jgi:hypothetical protein